MVVAVGISREGAEGWEANLLTMVKKPAARVLFLPTGSKDSAEYAASAEAGFRRAGALPESLFLTRNPSVKSVDQAFAAADLIFWGGGGAPLIVKHGDRYGVKERLIQAQERGAVLAGTSGGAIVLFEGGAGAYNGYRSLPGWGLAPGGLLPHFLPGQAAEAAPWFAENPDRLLYGLEDGAVLAWDGSRYVPASGAWRLTWNGQTVVSEPIAP